MEHGSTSPESRARRDAGRREASSEPSVAGAPEDAVEHAGPDATVAIEPTPDGFAIADDGPGIAPDEREHVLEWGYSTDSEGTGFGLAIVSEVVDAHGWAIDVGESDDGGLRLAVSVDDSRPRSD